MTAPQADPAVVPELVIRPPRRWGVPNLLEIWEHRDLLYFLTKRELQIRYRQSFFGVSWAVLQPLVLAFIFALFFGTVAKIETEIPYAAFAVAGLVPWLFTAQAMMQGANSLVLESSLISKVYFPRLILPLAVACSLLIDLVPSFLVVIVVGLIYGITIEPTIVLVPLFVFLGIVTTFGLSSLLAAVNVKYRDVQLVMPMVVQVIFFVSPVLYPGSLVPAEWRHVWAINPMVSVLDGTRWAFFGTYYPGNGVIAISVASALILLVVALIYFRKTEHYFADLV